MHPAWRGFRDMCMVPWCHPPGESRPAGGDQGGDRHDQGVRGLRRTVQGGWQPRQVLRQVWKEGSEAASRSQKAETKG